jgi:2-dehydro-3-deoxyphosphogluconate aldolase/(4S)-4-hydroxy-2-oxoglutarate aldolase
MTTEVAVLDDLGSVRRARIVPVFTVEDVAHAAPVGRALITAGMPIIEVTLRTPPGLDAIAAIAAIDGSMVGAGTVVTTQQVDSVAAAGAKFVVSPGFDPQVVARALDLGLLPIPGIATASEAQRALRLGLHLVKVFPAAQVGGPAFIAALSGPFPQLSFMPSGGVDEQTAPEYLELPSVAAVSGSWMLPRDLIAAERFDELGRLAELTRKKLVRVDTP